MARRRRPCSANHSEDDFVAGTSIVMAEAKRRNPGATDGTRVRLAVDQRSGRIAVQ